MTAMKSVAESHGECAVERQMLAVYRSYRPSILARVTGYFVKAVAAVADRNIHKTIIRELGHAAVSTGRVHRLYAEAFNLLVLRFRRGLSFGCRVAVVGFFEAFFTFF